MKEETKRNLFKSEEEALNVLKSSREKIDKLDNDFINIIYERTSLADSIVKAKTYLDMDVYDAGREKIVFQKAENLANEKNIDQDKLNQIMRLLVDLSKDRQRHILDNLE
ncbi:chorismate mutase [Methanobrevibacter sp.]